MVPLLSVIAAIVLHGIAQSSSSVSLPEFVAEFASCGKGVERTLAPIVALLTLALPYALGARARRSALTGDHRRGQIYQGLAENSGWIGFGVLLFAGGWIDAVRDWTGAALDLDGWPESALGLSFLPFAVYQFVAIDASVRSGGGAKTTQQHLRAFQYRMFIACLAPISVFIGASVLLGQSDWLRVQVEHVGLASVLFTGLLVLILAQLLPWLLRWSWDTVPFPEGPQRDRLQEVARAAEFEPRDIRIWRTGGLMANAAIVGFTPRGRTVLFSDQLLSLLNTRELCAVYAHEIGHARRGHVTVFLCWTLGFIFLGDYLARMALDAQGVLAGALVGLAALATWFFSFGWLSRRFELDADLFSLQTVEDLPALVSALERVGGREREASGWRHFGVGRRIRFLAKTVSNEDFVARFRRRLRWLAAAGVGLALVGAGLQLLDVVQSLPRDRAVASLARGKYGQATSLAAQLEGEDAAEIRELAETAARIGSGSRAAVHAALDEALRAALEGGDASEARNLAVVAGLRGVPNASELATELGAWIECGSSEPPCSLDQAARAWQRDAADE